MLKEELLLAWWRLRRLPGVGTVTVNEIRSGLSAPSDLLSLNEQDLIRAGLKPAAAAAYFSDDALSDGFDRVKDWCSLPQQGVLLVGEPPVPEALSSLRDAPVMLWYRGQLSALQQPMLAIVGSRAATPAALEWTTQVAEAVAAAGVTVVSGLALGIDGAAHKGAVRSGRTIAVMGTGPDRIYPARHQRLAQDILREGLLLTEFPPGTAPQARQFPSRNRIISGLCQTVLIVEASVQSGSMITARLAADQGRDVLAMPGAVNNPLSAGPHQLIRDGALLVENAEQILEAMDLSLPLSGTPANHSATHPEPPPALVTMVDYSTTATDVIGLRAGLSPSELMTQLLELELNGWIRQQPGGYVRLR